MNMNEVREGRRKDSIFPTYISPMDRMMTGFKPTEFILLGGRPAMGKTLLALQIAMNQAMADIPVVFFTLEMSAEQLTQRMLSNLATMDGAHFLNPTERISTKDFMDLGQKADLLKSKPLYIVDLHQANLDRIEGEIAVVGITEFAQSELGDIVFVEIDTVGESIDSEQVFGSVEAVKTVSDLFMPISGEITEFNGLLETAPETVNSDPYGDGWMVKVKMSNADDISNLLSAADYKALIGH